MSNMSYCRWRNTYMDVQDCLDEGMDDSDISDDERKYRRYLFQVVLEAACDYGLIDDFDDARLEGL